MAAAILPAAAHAAETGVDSDMTSGISRKTQDKTVTALRGVHAQWVRMTINWSDYVEPSDGTYNSSELSGFDRGIDLARGAGYKIILTVQGSPSWAHDGTNGNSPPRDNAELAEFMAFLASRYAGRVQAYQVWNEPNLAWAWPSGPDAGGYARMLRAVAPSIRAADPAAKVVFAGLFMNDYEYLEGAYAAVPNLGDYFDVMATHPVVYFGRAPEAMWFEDDGRISKGAFSAYREVRASMEAQGDTKPIWLTGFTWSTTTQGYSIYLGVSPEVQADYLVRAYNCLEQDSYVQVATWNALRNEAWRHDANTWASQLGLMTTTFAPKPAYNALKDYAPGAGGCTYSLYVPPVVPQPAPEPSLEPTDEPEPNDGAEVSSEPEPSQEEEEPVTSSTVRSSPMLAVGRAQFRRGRLTILARVASGATGRIRGTAHFGRGRRRFTAPIDSTTGMIRIDQRLRGARGASAARVTLVYRGSRRFLGQRVTFRAIARGSQVRILSGALL